MAIWTALAVCSGVGAAVLMNWNADAYGANRIWLGIACYLLGAAQLFFGLKLAGFI